MEVLTSAGTCSYCGAQETSLNEDSSRYCHKCCRSSDPHTPTPVPVRKLLDGIIGYRWQCSCGREGKGMHPTEAKALMAAGDHTKPPKPPKPPKPLSIEQRFTRAVQVLAENGFTREDIWEQIMGLSSALRQGGGLDGVQMDEIITEALDTSSSRD